MAKTGLRVVAWWLLAPLLVLAASPTLAALPQRTFVASSGSDANVGFNCSLTKPCRTFTAALTVTNDLGEIVVLDTAGYGAVTIDRSVAIIAPPGVYAGISVFSGAGVKINTGGLRITLRGLVINGQLGDYGVDVGAVGGTDVTIEMCRISNLLADGIQFQSTGALRVRDTIIHANKGSGVSMAAGIGQFDNVRIEDSGQEGVVVKAGAHASFTRSVITGSQQNGVIALSTSGTGVATAVSLDDVTISESGDRGVWVLGTGVGNQARVTIRNSTLTRNAGHAAAYGAGVEIAAGALLVIIASEITNNGGGGVYMTACSPLSSAIALVSHSQIAHNNVGLSTPGGMPPPGCQLRVNRTNQVRANATDFAGTITSEPAD